MCFNPYTDRANKEVMLPKKAFSSPMKEKNAQIKDTSLSFSIEPYDAQNQTFQNFKNPQLEKSHREI
jgi:hypothetical protein